MQAGTFFIRVDGSEEGPVTYQELVGLVRGGTFNPFDEVRPEGSEAWARADTIPGLFGEAQISAARAVPQGTGFAKTLRFQLVCTAASLGLVCLLFQWLVFAPRRPNHVLVRAWNEYLKKIEPSGKELARVRKEIQQTFLGGKESAPTDEWIAASEKAMNDLTQMSPGEFKIAEGHRKLIDYALSIKTLAVASQLYFERPGEEGFAEIERKFSESDRALKDLNDWIQRFMKENRFEMQNPQQDGK